MRLPNAHLAVVEQGKITGYLLNPAHRFGSGKARFFNSFGFRMDDWETLARALYEHAQRHEVTVERETGFGPRYEVDGPLDTPDGRSPRVRTGLATGPRRSCSTPDHGVPSGGEMTISEHDVVVLTEAAPDAGLEAGDIGTVVHVHGAGAGFEVEFMTLTGDTVAVVTLRPAQVRPVQSRDVAHVRELAATGS